MEYLAVGLFIIVTMSLMVVGLAKAGARDPHAEALEHMRDMGTVTALQGVLEEVREERIRQEMRFGEQNHALPEYNLILIEEVGEVSRALSETYVEPRLRPEKAGLKAARGELVQVSAVAAAMVERIDRRLAAMRDDEARALKR